jgi:hypothetical protein
MIASATMLNKTPPRFELTPSAIEEFQRIYQAEFGEEITSDAAKEMAERLLRLYAILAKNE